MREYGQIQCSFWTDPDIQSLSDQARQLAAYLLTGPHSNGLGCYRLQDGYVMADFGWDSETVSKGFQELFDIGFSERCEKTQFVLIPKFLYWNPIANANVAKAREREFDTVSKKSCVFIKLIDCLNRYGNHLPNGFVNRLETLSKQYGKQNPTQPNPIKPQENNAYAFQGETVKINQQDYEKLAKQYPNLDLQYQLNQLDLELKGKKNWFVEMNSKLNYRNRTPAHHKQQSQGEFIQ